MELEVHDRHPASGGESVMNDTSSGYIVRNHPGYEPRYMFEHLYVIVILHPMAFFISKRAYDTCLSLVTNLRAIITCNWP